jgi:hypothetical protein
MRLNILIAGVMVSASTSAHAAITYANDDGSIDLFHGPTTSQSTIFINQFEVTGGQNIVQSVEAFLESTGGSLAVTAGIWSDPNQDGDPTDALLLGTSAPTVAIGAAAFEPFSLLAPVNVGPNGTKFFVGIFWQDQNIIPLLLGSDSLGGVGPVGQSWLAQYPGAADPNDLSGVLGEAPDQAYMIRANAIPAPGGCAILALSGISASRRRR